MDISNLKYNSFFCAVDNTVTFVSVWIFPVHKTLSSSDTVHTINLGSILTVNNKRFPFAFLATLSNGILVATLIPHVWICPIAQKNTRSCLVVVSSSITSSNSLFILPFCSTYYCSAHYCTNNVHHQGEGE